MSRPRTPVSVAVSIARTHWLLPSVVAIVGCGGHTISPTEDAGTHDVSASHDVATVLDGSTGSPDVAGTGLDVPATAIDAPIESVDAMSATLPSPRVQITNQGGPVYDNPTYVVVDYTGDPNASFVENYVRTFATSSLFTSMLGEYGVHAGTYGMAYQLATPPCAAPCMLNQTSGADPAGQLLADAISAGTVPMPGEQTIIVFKLPPGITSDGGCDYGYSYHSFEPSMGFAYDVIYECSDPDLGPSQILGEDLSHEMCEAATDPDTGFNPGWIIGWDPQGGEICDYCGDTYADLDGLTVQRVYSNAAAAAGLDPCIPYGTGPFPTGYAAAGPTVSTLTVTRGGAGVPLNVQVFGTPGAYGTVDVYASGSNGINVTPADYSVLNLGGMVTYTISAASNARTGSNNSVWVFSNPDSAQYAYEEWPVQITVQ